MSTLPFSKVIAVDPTNPNADYTTIQAAINAAVSGNVIVVGPGVYNEQLTLKSGIRIVGAGWEGIPRTVISSNFYLADGYLVNTQANTVGFSILENLAIEALFDGASGNIVGAVHTDKMTLRLVNCYVLNRNDSSFGGGKLYGVLATNSALVELDRCKVEVSDPAFQADLHNEVLLTGVSLKIKNSLIEGLDALDSVVVDSGSAVVNIESSFLNGYLRVKKASSVSLDGASRIDGTNILDDENENVAQLRSYGLLKSNGKNDLFKLNLRQLSSDPVSADNGDLWYNNTAGKFKAKENGSVVDLIGGGGLSASQASSIVSATTGSTSYVLLDDMSLIPGAGNYVLMFGTSAENSSNNASIFFAVYVNGAVVQHTEREARRGGSSGNNMDVVALQAYLPSVGAGQAIEIQWKVSGGTATARERTLVLMKI